MAMISTNLFSISLNHFSVSIILLLIPSSVFFISVIVLFISVSLLNLFIKHLVCLLNLCLHSFFKSLSHLYYYYSKFFFQVACLTPLHLVFLGDFDLVPSSQIYYSAILLCLIFCFWSPFSWLWDGISSFFCACPWVREFVQTSRWEGLMPAH